jgi:hypothetical protein
METTAYSTYGYNNNLQSFYCQLAVFYKYGSVHAFDKLMVAIMKQKQNAHNETESEMSFTTRICNTIKMVSEFQSLMVCEKNENFL